MASVSATRCPSRAALEHARSALGVRCAWYESRHYPYPPGLLEAHEEIRAILREADIRQHGEAAKQAESDKAKGIRRCPDCKQAVGSGPGHLCSANHEEHCAIRTTRDGWDADCSCKRGEP